MRKILSVFLLLLVLCFKSSAQTVFPLDASLWLLDPQQPDQGTPFNKKGTLAFNFADYAVTPDAFTGNLLLPWSSPLVGSQFTATFQIITFPSGDKPVRFIAPETGCVSPCAASLYFQTGGLYNDTEGTRWWAQSLAWVLADGTVTVIISLDPAVWSATFGHNGAQLPAEFANALAHPTYVGVTFGGNCRAGHGVQTRKGSAQFRLSGYRLE